MTVALFDTWAISGGSIIDTQTIDSAGTTVTASTGNAALAGLLAVVLSGTTVTCITGNDALAGLAATVLAPTVIICTVGNAAFAGLTADVNQIPPYLSEYESAVMQDTAVSVLAIMSEAPIYMNVRMQ